MSGEFAAVDPQLEVALIAEGLRRHESAPSPASAARKLITPMGITATERALVLPVSASRASSAWLATSRSSAQSLVIQSISSAFILSMTKSRTFSEAT